MVEILRDKWCEDLDEILQCPICFECPKTLIYQCLEGHHICAPCKDKLTGQCACPHCPTCGQGWSTLRNRVAESLCSKLEDIKLSLIDPENEINKLLLPDTFCAETQTDNMPETAIEAVSNSNLEAVPNKNPIVGHSGTYPCRIGSCKINSSFERLFDHITTAHSMHFSEIPMGNNDLIFQHTWHVHWMEQLQFDRVFRIPRVGSFFMKVSSNLFGDFTGFVSMIHNALISKQYLYQLKIGSITDSRPPTYTGDVNSCRTPITDLGQKCLQVKSAEIQQIISESKVLKCTVLLSKKLLEDFHIERKKKNRAKNRNNATKAAPPAQDQNVLLLGI